MSMRRPDPHLQRAWRSKPPRSQRVVQGALALVALVAVAIAAAFVMRSCDDESEVVPASLAPLTTTSTSTTTTTTTTLPPPVTYEIRSGDSLFSIAQLFGISVAELIELNGIDDPDRIEAGDELLIPPTATTQPPEPTDATTSAESPAGSPAESPDASGDATAVDDTSPGDTAP